MRPAPALLLSVSDKEKKGSCQGFKLQTKASDLEAQEECLSIPSELAWANTHSAHNFSLKKGKWWVDP